MDSEILKCWGELASLFNFSSPETICTSPFACMGDRVTVMNLTGLEIEGPIPDSIGNLSELAVLDLLANRLTGAIPSTIGNLAKLQYLDLGQNLLTGPLPGSFGNLLELKHLFLYDCALSGVLPSSLSNLVQLKSLWLADNLFVGEIDFGALTNLNSLVIGNNYFNSFASSFENLTQLSYVDMRHNFFGGRVPEFLGACSSLTNFNGGFNGFTGSLPNSFGDLALLQSLNLESNYINGFFPASWARMTSLDQLWLNNNSLEGSLFPLNFLSKLTLLVLSFNSLSGAIADTTSSESNLQYLYLDNNLFSVLPESVGRFIHLRFLVLHHNLFTGSLPASLGSLALMEYIDLSFNFFTGNLTSLNQLDSLSSIYISHNFFTGSVPTQLLQHSNLSIFVFDNNHFTGSLEWKDTLDSGLQTLVASNNQISGLIPSNYFENMPHLLWLDLSFNNHRGPLPEIFPGSLFILDLSSNFFSGVIPDSWSGLGARRISLGNNQLYSHAPLTITLPLVSFVDLSDNPLSSFPAADFLSLRSPGFLNTSGPRFDCPYPPNPPAVWLRDPCITDLSLLWYLLLASGLAVLVAFACIRLPRFCDKWGHFRQNLTKERKLYEFFLWANNVRQCVMVSLFYRTILQYLSSLPASPEQCEAFNYDFQPLLYPRLDVRIYRNSIFSVYLQQLQAQFDSDEIGGLISMREMNLLLNFTITSFREQCSEILGCSSSHATSARCVIHSSFKPFPTFTSLVSFFFALVILQEIFKLLCLIWALCSRNSTPRLFPICGQSVFLPLLAAQPGMITTVILYQPSVADKLAIFVYEGCFESFPQLLLQIYYILFVTKVGVSPWQLFTFFCSSIMILKLLFVACIFPLLQHACQVDKMSKNSLNQPLNSSA